MRHAVLCVTLALLVAVPARTRDDVPDLAALRDRATRGDVLARDELGRRLRFGKGVARDPAEAATWFQRAADAGHPPSLVQLGLLHHHGEGVPKDDAKAVVLFRAAAERGDPDGTFNLALHLGRGLGVARDDAESARWYRKSAELGDGEAMLRLAEAYRDGRGVAADRGQAWTWGQLALASIEDERLHWQAVGVLEGLAGGTPLHHVVQERWMREARRAAEAWSGPRDEVARLEEKAGKAEDRGGFVQARETLSEALRLARAAQLDVQWVARITYNLGRVAGHAGDATTAERLLRQALALDEGLTGATSESVAMTRFELARLMHDTGRHAEAVPEYERGLAIARRFGAPVADPLAFAADLEDLAASLRAAGRPEEATAAATEARALREANPGVRPSFVPTRYR
jgi:TPR repeat protein